MKDVRIIDNPLAIFETVLRIVFVRHGNAALPMDGVEDNDRRLTDLGFRQAEAIGGKVRNSGPFDLILSSPATRTRLTAMRAFDAEPEGVINLETLSTTPPGVDNGVIEQEFLRLGHAPLRQYIGGPATTSLFLAGHRAASEILERAGKLKTSDERRPIVAVVGHGVLLQAVALAFGNALDGTQAGRHILDSVVDILMGEAHAIELTLLTSGHDASVVHLQPGS